MATWFSIRATCPIQTTSREWTSTITNGVLHRPICISDNQTTYMFCWRRSWNKTRFPESCDGGFQPSRPYVDSLPIMPPIFEHGGYLSEQRIPTRWLCVSTCLAYSGTVHVSLVHLCPLLEMRAGQKGFLMYWQQINTLEYDETASPSLTSNS
jgi:hypothetical protein